MNESSLTKQNYEEVQQFLTENLEDFETDIKNLVDIFSS